MRIFIGLQAAFSFSNGVALSIGNFDGVHCGHQQILRTLRREADARNLPAVLMIFEPQPPEFFLKKSKPYRLTPLRDKINLLRQTGCLDALWVLKFNHQLASLSAQDFIHEILVHRLNTKYLLIGDDFRFGAQRLGDFNLLKNDSHFAVDQVSSVMLDGIRASSTAVREALYLGDLELAKHILGTDYALSGRVMHGKKLGRLLQTPTANIHLAPHCYALSGVFVVEVKCENGIFGGVASLGKNPTVSDSHQQKLEVHLFDFKGNLYGKRLKVSFLHKLRDEVKFLHLDDLKAQIDADKENARNYLNKIK